MSILTKAQAEALYSAVCALNNVSFDTGTQISFVGVRNNGEFVRYTFEESTSGEVKVYVGGGLLACEREVFADQNAFAEAYGLQ